MAETESNWKDKYLKPVTDDEYETCEICGKLTDAKVTTHISQRKYYIYGAGQCCAECWQELYGRTGESGDTVL